MCYLFYLFMNKMPPKNCSALTLEQRIEVIKKSKKDCLSARKIAEHFVVFFFSWGIVIKKNKITWFKQLITLFYSEYVRVSVNI